MERDIRPEPGHRARWFEGMLWRLCFIPVILYYALFMVLLRSKGWVYSAGTLLATALPLVVMAVVMFLAIRGRHSAYVKRLAISFFLVTLTFSTLATVTMELQAQERKFNYNSWVSKPDQRLRMVDHFLRQYGLEGRSKDSVLSVLGLPDAPQQQEIEEAKRWRYELGVERSADVHVFKELMIEFNNGRLVSSYAVKNR